MLEGTVVTCTSDVLEVLPPQYSCIQQEYAGDREECDKGRYVYRDRHWGGGWMGKSPTERRGLISLSRQRPCKCISRRQFKG